MKFLCFGVSGRLKASSLSTHAQSAVRALRYLSIVTLVKEVFVLQTPNLSVKRYCGTGVAGFLNRLRAAAPYLQR